MQWYEDEAYVSWQDRDGSHSKYLERARRYARRAVEEDRDNPKRVKNEVAAAAIQLNSEYAAWRASLMVERSRCILYAETLAQISIQADKREDTGDDRLKITAAIAYRIATDIRHGKHWANVWNEEVPIGNKDPEGEVSDLDEG